MNIPIFQPFQDFFFGLLDRVSERGSEDTFLDLVAIGAGIFLAIFGITMETFEEAFLEIVFKSLGAILSAAGVVSFLVHLRHSWDKR